MPNERQPLLDLPTSISSEVAIVGAMLAFPEQARLWAPRIQPGWLSQDIGRRVVAAAVDIIQTGRDPTFIAIRDAMRKTMPQDSGIGGRTWQQALAEMAAGLTSTDIAGDIALLKAVWSQREIVALANDIAVDGDGDRVSAAAAVWDKLDDIRSALIDVETTRAPISVIAGEVAAAVERFVETGQQPLGVTTGLPLLDHVMLGYRPGELVLVAGRPGMGKTSWGTSSALSASDVRRGGRRAGAAFFSLELSREAIGARCLSDIAYEPRFPLPHSAIRGFDLNEEQVWRLRDAAKRLEDHALVVECVGSVTVHEIGVRARSIARTLERRGTPLGVIFVDYLKFVKATDRYKGQRVYEIGEITRALREIAKQLGVCVVLFCQINRGPEQREDKRPQLSDLRDSGDLENDADVVILLYREAYYLARDARGDGPEASAAAVRLGQVSNQIELIVAKNRNGEGEQTIRAFCDIGASAIRPLDFRRE